MDSGISKLQSARTRRWSTSLVVYIHLFTKVFCSWILNSWPVFSVCLWIYQQCTCSFLPLFSVIVSFGIPFAIRISPRCRTDRETYGLSKVIALNGSGHQTFHDFRNAKLKHPRHAGPTSNQKYASYNISATSAFDYRQQRTGYGMRIAKPKCVCRRSVSHHWYLTQFTRETRTTIRINQTKTLKSIIGNPVMASMNTSR